MGLTVQFSTDASAPPYQWPVAGLMADGDGTFGFVIAGLLATDTVGPAQFVAKIDRTYPDNDPTTIILYAGGNTPSTGCTLTPNVGGTVYDVEFYFDQAQTQILLAAHVYDVYLTVLRGSDTFYVRLVSGSIQAGAPTITLPANSSPAGTPPLIWATVLGVGTNGPPASPVTGDGYVVGSAPTGAWVGYSNAIAVWTSGAWVFSTPAAGWRVYNVGDGNFYGFNGAAWAVLTTETSPPANYAGQATITTVGTITQGTWQGTAVSDSYIAAMAASKLTGTSLPPAIVGSSLTSVGTIGTGTWQGTPVAAAYLGTHDIITKHTTTTATAGYVIRASGPSVFAWAQLQFADLGGTPTTLAGYGIADTYTAATIDSKDAATLASANAHSDAYLHAALGTVAVGVWQGTPITDTYLAAIGTAGKVANSATTATALNTASAIVARDASGNFAAGTITAALIGNVTGNAATVTAGVYTTGSYADPAWITSLAASKLAGSTLPAGITVSSLAQVGTITSGVWNGTVITTAYTAAQVESVAGTAHRLTVGGTTALPTLDIAADYVGQNTITTLGGVATGVWEATPIAVGYGGTGLTAAAVGELLAASGANTWSRLGGNSSTTREFLISTGTGTAAQLPVWGTLVAGDIPALSAAIITSGVLNEAQGGTGHGSYYDGDLLYGTAPNSLAILAGNAALAKKFLVQSGTGTVPNAPQWWTLTISDLTDLPVLTTQGGTGLSSYTAGDLVYYASSSAFTKLGIGASGQLLRSTGSAPAWHTLVTADITDLATAATGITKIGTLVSGAVPASLVTAGPFGPGNYTFLGALTVSTGPLIIGTDPGGTDLLRVGGGATISGTVTIGTYAYIAATATNASVIVDAPAAAAARTDYRKAGAQAWLVGRGAVDGSDDYQIESVGTGHKVFSIARADDSVFFAGNLTFAALGGGGGAVTAGAVDSGGTGYRLLRVPN